MGELLGDEYEAFLDSYKRPTRRGLRFNLLKTQDDLSGLYHDLSLTQESGGDTGRLNNSDKPDTKPAPISQVPWCTEGFEYPTEARPAKNPLYNAGLFYIQEPSAMSPAAVLRPRPGQRVLDLCAAPGGKSVQLAGYMQGQGLLVSNDASPSRSRALVKNLEMAGVTNAIVLTEMPHRLAARFEGFFDCVLVDAPCSGEGMFRRDPDAIKAYTANKPEACATLQQEILRHAAKMLRPGGRLVYSTCTFNTVENEGTVAAFLSSHSYFTLMPIGHESLGLSPGYSICQPGAATTTTTTIHQRAEDATKINPGHITLEHTARIWPHKAPGEGHFIALMMKTGGNEGNEPPLSYTLAPKIGIAAFPDFKKGRKLPEEFLAFCRDSLIIPTMSDDNLKQGVEDTPPNNASLGNPIDFTISSNASPGDPRRKKTDTQAKLYLQPAYENFNPNQPDISPLGGLRIARSGWLLGECAKGRFTPSQALAMGITKAQARHAVDLSEPDAKRYLKGESLPPPEDFIQQTDKPWVLVCHKGHPLGWARLVQGRLKNHLPTSWI